METLRFEEAEKELLVAVAQSPRNLVAHELLARLYRQHLQQPANAFAHEGRALSLRNELALRKRAGASISPASPSRTIIQTNPMRAAPLETVPWPFDAEVTAGQIITVVSGLPRSGTSMMMQLLVASGRKALTDFKRAADEDNPLGYFEFEKTLELAKNVSWVPEARGKVVKIVAHLLPFLPPTEHYHVIFMERNLAEVIASQTAMLARRGRRGAELDAQQLMETYSAQLQRLRGKLAGRPDMRILPVPYNQLLPTAPPGAHRLPHFLCATLVRFSATASIHPPV